MKPKIFIFVLFCVGFNEVYTQNLSVEFSIEWKEKLNFQFKEFKDENIRPAYLNIIYRNISNKPLYCLKITEGKADLPEIILFYDSVPYWIEKTWLRVNDDYFKRQYFVGFKSEPYYRKSASWDIRNDTTDIEYKIIKETRERPRYSIGGYMDENGNIHEDVFWGKIIGGDTVTLNDWILTTLDNIYNVIYHRYYPKIQEKTDEEQWHHYSTDITGDTIMNNSIDKFVFLKPGETYEDEYNLIGFQITGGTFTFQLDNTKSVDYVETEPVYKDEYKIEIDYYVKKQLPLKVGEYELFTGEFLTNKVTAYFPGIRLEE